MGQLGVEGFARVGVGEVGLLVAPSGDGVDHARDQLAHAGLALRGAERAAEILRDDDVGGSLRPSARHFDVVLLEDDAPVLAGDDGAARDPIRPREYGSTPAVVKKRSSMTPRPAAPELTAAALEAGARSVVLAFESSQIYRSPAHHRILPAQLHAH